MTTVPQPRRPHPWRRRAQRFLHTLRTQLTRQFITRNRRLAFVLSVVTIAIAVASVHVSAWWFSPGVMILPILAGGLLLWPRALRIFFGFAAVALIYDVFEDKAGAGIIATIVLTAVFADVLARTREKLGVQGLRGDRMLLELRDRIRAQGKLPELGEGWGSSLVLKPAGGSSFGGDFVVSFCDGKTLEVALVDVSGKGIDAGTRALLLSGAFGGLLGSVPREEFLPACNAYMRRGASSEGFVTAVHLSLDLASGEYVLSSAGHPPAVHYDGSTGRWRLTAAHGIVLGVLPDLHGAATQPERFEHEQVVRRANGHELAIRLLVGPETGQCDLRSRLAIELLAMLVLLAAALAGVVLLARGEDQHEAGGESNAPFVATSFVNRFVTAAAIRTRNTSDTPMGISTDPIVNVQRHFELPRPAVAESQDDHCQRLKHEAPHHAEGVGFAQHAARRRG